jgi:hypothetical protein
VGNPNHISMKVGFELRRDQRPALFGGEDHVNQESGRCAPCFSPLNRRLHCGSNAVTNVGILTVVAALRASFGYTPCTPGSKLPGANLVWALRAWMKCAGSS